MDDGDRDQRHIPTGKIKLLPMPGTKECRGGVWKSILDRESTQISLKVPPGHCALSRKGMV